MIRLVVALVVPALAFADTATEQEVSRALATHAAGVQVLRTDLGAYVDKALTAASCTRAIDKARAANLPAGFELAAFGNQFEKFPGSYQSGGKWALRMSSAHQICSELGRLTGLATARTQVADAMRSLDWLAIIDKSTNHEENGARLAASAKGCQEGSRALAAGGIQQLEVRIGGSPKVIAVAELASKVCQPLATASASFANEVAAARKAAWEKAARPYKDAGFTGDRLDFVVGNSGTAIFVAGGKEISGDLKALKRAKVLFYRLTGSGSITLKRHEFRGDQLVAQSQSEHLTQPPAAAYR